MTSYIYIRRQYYCDRRLSVCLTVNKRTQKNRLLEFHEIWNVGRSWIIEDSVQFRKWSGTYPEHIVNLPVDHQSTAIRGDTKFPITLLLSLSFSQVTDLPRSAKRVGRICAVASTVLLCDHPSSVSVLTDESERWKYNSLLLIVDSQLNCGSMSK